jgi:hypothetical protein
MVNGLLMASWTRHLDKRQLYINCLWGRRQLLWHSRSSSTPPRTPHAISFAPISPVPRCVIVSYWFTVSLSLSLALFRALFSLSLSLSLYLSRFLALSFLSLPRPSFLPRPRLASCVGLRCARQRRRAWVFVGSSPNLTAAGLHDSERVFQSHGGAAGR